MDKKEIISYYDMGGRDAQMYSKIDGFLALTKRFSPAAVKRTKLIACSVCFGLGGLTIIGAAIWVVRSMAYGGAFLGGLFRLIIAAFLIGVGIYMLKVYGSTPFIEMVRSDRIISADGLEKVYDDLVHARQLQGTKILLGCTYIFKKGDCLYRIRDISRFFIREESDDDGTTYFACAEVRDESGIKKVDIVTLSGFRQSTREQKFREIVAPIETARHILQKIDDDFEV